MRANIAWLKKFRLRRRGKHTNLTDLPLDILVNILTRLPVKSLYRIRRSSKILKNIVDDQSFLTLHTWLVTATNAVAEVPQLILITNIGVTSFAAVQLFEYDGNSSLEKSKHAVVSEIGLTVNPWSNRRFVFCNLFFFTVENLSKYESPYAVLFDPFKVEVLPLPMIDVQDPKERYGVYGMGFDHLTSTHKIIRVYVNTQNNMEAQVIVLGTSSWRKIRSVPPYLLSTSTRLLSANGDMHWLIHLVDEFSNKTESHIISFDFKKEEFYCTPHPIQSTRNMHLFILRGCMAFMAITGTEVEIWMLKNYERKEWTREYAIDLRVHGRTLEDYSRIAGCGQWEHGIFFLDSRRNALFFDVRCDSIKDVTYPMLCPRPRSPVVNIVPSIHSCTPGLISLKHYGNVIDQEQMLFGVNNIWNPASSNGLKKKCYSQKNITGSVNLSTRTFLK
nr:putative F-box protein At3g21120 [Malus domestica]